MTENIAGKVKAVLDGIYGISVMENNHPNSRHDIREFIISYKDNFFKRLVKRISVDFDDIGRRINLELDTEPLVKSKGILVYSNISDLEMVILRKK